MVLADAVAQRASTWASGGGDVGGAAARRRPWHDGAGQREEVVAGW